MRKIAVVMTYYNREFQLRKTLETIGQTKHDDYCVVVVNDASDKPLMIHMADDYGIEKALVVEIGKSYKTWKDVVPFNIGLRDALVGGCYLDTESNWWPDIVIIQNAECYHVGDVLMYADEHVTDDNFVSFACWSLSEEQTSTGKYDLNDLISRDKERRARDHGTGWYNHPNVNPRYYHFCTAITADNMRKLNGLDERFMNGRGADDNDLVRRMRNLGLEVHATTEKMPFVVHQWHPPSHIQELADHNNEVYCDIKTNEPHNYRAQHIITEDFDKCVS